jgi:hypothetical protein
MAPFIYRTGPATSNEKYPHHQSKAKTTMIFPFQNDGLISIVLAHCFLFVFVFFLLNGLKRNRYSCDADGPLGPYQGPIGNKKLYRSK